MTIVEILVGVLATAGLFAWFGLHGTGRGGGCASCSGECGGGACSLSEGEEFP